MSICKLSYSTKDGFGIHGIIWFDQDKIVFHLKNYTRKRKYFCVLNGDL